MDFRLGFIDIKKRIVVSAYIAPTLYSSVQIKETEEIPY